jgi:hypothetical protein
MAIIQRGCSVLLQTTLALLYHVSAAADTAVTSKAQLLYTVYDCGYAWRHGHADRLVTTMAT